ncbi:SGNH/GDSL hydrolase family protein [Enterococcus songbeiensis]
MNLNKKKIYAFGDSIIKGHVYHRSFVDELAEKNTMDLEKFALNGATLIQTGKEGFPWLLQEIYDAPTENPDLILLDGGINDLLFLDELLEKGILDETIQDLFENALVKTLWEIKRKWINVPIAYIQLHRLPARKWDLQLMMHRVNTKICMEMGIYFIDFFAGSTFDTRVEEQRKKYSFDNLNQDGQPGINGSGTHPNVDGYRTFYVPFVENKLKDL